MSIDGEYLKAYKGFYRSVWMAINALMKKYTLAITEEMEKKLESERKRRLLDSIPETVRVILSEHFSGQSPRV